MMTNKETIKVNIEYSNLFHFIIALLFLGTFYPFVHNYVLFGTDKKALVSLFALGIWTISIVLRNPKNLKLPEKAFNIIIFTQIIFIFIWSYIIDSQGIRMQSINLALSWYFVLLVINSIDVQYFIKIFIRINIISLILCIIGITLVILGITELYSTHIYQGDKNIYNYLFFFIKRTDVTYLNIRPAGYYDEPGSFSYVVMYLLLLNRKFYKNMKWEYALLLLPLVTTSLAHIFTGMLFIIMYYRKVLNLKYLIVIISLVATLFLFYNNFKKTEYGQYYIRKTTDRIEKLIKGEGEIGRGGGYELGPKIFIENFLGTSPENVQKEFPDFVNEVIWAPLIYYGVLGIGFFYLLFIYIFAVIIKTKNNEGLFALILLVINLLQRPNYMSPIFILLIYYLFFIPNPSKQVIINE
jgi:hypothetical protein